MTRRHRIRTLFGVGVLGAVVTVLAPAPAGAAVPAFTDVVGPAGSGAFGTTVTVLTNGNVVVTDPLFDLPGAADAGAVYLYDGGTRALLATLTGSQADDRVGNAGVVALSNGNYVVVSFFWSNGVVPRVGAVTWGDGTTGVAGVVSAANSLVGTTAEDTVGTDGVTPLTNGNYVVASTNWDNGAVVDAGAVTWANGTTGLTGAVTTANSLYGPTTEDWVGPSVTALTNGNYVVTSPWWDNGGVVDAGAATWANGTTGLTGPVTTANSLYGTQTADQVSAGGVTRLPNGAYVVRSGRWDNAGVVDAGAVTWSNGAPGITGAVSAANSLVGSTADDKVGGTGFGRGVVVLTNGNYVVVSPDWDNGAAVNAGAATWANGTTGIVGPVTTANSLHGSTAGDQVGEPPIIGDGVIALTNGNYTVLVWQWDNGGVVNAGAVVWADGSTGIAGPVTTANSLYGPAVSDYVGLGGVTPLTNGNYVVNSHDWNDGATTQVGAVTWGDGDTGITGPVTTANSLYGSSKDDWIGYDGGTTRGMVVALANGNYVVVAPRWDDGAAVDAGAAVLGNGTSASAGPVTSGNSLHGAAGDWVGEGGATALTDGNFVLTSFIWSGVASSAGAVTWSNGTTFVPGTVTTANSLIGTSIDDNVGSEGVVALPGGNYVVSSSYWDGPAADSGAVTWGDGGSTASGAVGPANSVTGSAAGGGATMRVVVDPVHTMVIVARPADNVVTWIGGTAAPATVTVTKTAVGAVGSWSFQITISPPVTGQPATRTATSAQPAVTWTGLMPGVTYQIAEVPSADWDEGPVACTGATGDKMADATFMPAAGNSVSCSVQNTAELPVTGSDPTALLAMAVVALGLGLGVRRAAMMTRPR